MLYYRQKVLLALLEQFGGRIGRTDCQKLLFLYCKSTGRNHYDFFPYQYGGLSFLSYRDKSTLTSRDLLADTDDFQLRTATPFSAQLTRARDREQLADFALDYAGRRGKALVREAYLSYPQYTARSTILHSILTQKEIDDVGSWCNHDDSPCLFTIGYQDRTIDAYLDCLISSNVGALVDVRDNARSMKYGFSLKQFRRYVRSAGLEYYHLPGLGVPRNLRNNLTDPEDYRRLFVLYSRDILPRCTDDIEELSSLLTRHGRVALTCFERDSQSCHRHCISDYLANVSSPTLDVVHL